MTKVLPVVLLIAATSMLQACSGDADARLETLMAEFWQAEMEASPLAATAMGTSGFDHQLARVSEEALENRVRDYDRALSELGKIDHGDLSAANQINRQVLEWLLTVEASHWVG